MALRDDVTVANRRPRPGGRFAPSDRAEPAYRRTSVCGFRQPRLIIAPRKGRASCRRPAPRRAIRSRCVDFLCMYARKSGRRRMPGPPEWSLLRVFRVLRVTRPGAVALGARCEEAGEAFDARQTVKAEIGWRSEN